MISALICTRNRAGMLTRVMEDFFAQDRLDELDYELVIVDNSSTDKTKEVVETFSRRFPKKVRYIFEERLGIRVARNRAIDEAKGDTIVFTDDDVKIDKMWLFEMAEVFTLGADAAGGRVIADYPKDTPDWIKRCQRFLNGPIVAHDYGEEVKIYDIKNMSPFIAANAAFRKDVIKNAGGFKEDLGHGQLVLGEDTELFERLIRLGKKIVYCGKAAVWHPVIKERMNLGYIARWYMAQGRSYAAQDDDKILSGDYPRVLGIPRFVFGDYFREAMAIVLNCYNREKMMPHWNKFFRAAGIIQEMSYMRNEGKL